MVWYILQRQVTTNTYIVVPAFQHFRWSFSSDYFFNSPGQGWKPGNFCLLFIFSQNQRHRDLSIHIERVLWVMFWRPVMYRPKMGIVKTRKLSVRPKIILFSKTVQDYGNRSADICLVMQAVGQAGHSLSTRQLRSLWSASMPTRPLRPQTLLGNLPFGFSVKLKRHKSLKGRRPSKETKRQKRKRETSKEMVTTFDD